MTIITVVTKDRNWTDAESASIEQYHANAFAAGDLANLYTSADSTLNWALPQITIRIWNTIDSANAYVAFILGFTPQQPSAYVKEI